MEKHHINLTEGFAPFGHNVIPTKNINFPGGEVQPSIDFEEIEKVKKTNFWKKDIEVIMITAYLKDGSEIMKLLNIVEACKRHFKKIPLELFIPYIPYARQDRVCNAGESLAIKVFANVINSCGFDNVYVVDPHSYVSTAVIEEAVIIPNWQIVSCALDLFGIDTSSPYYLVSPDAGANKKIFELVRTLGGNGDIVQADKERNLKTGQIIRTVVHAEDHEKVKGNDMVIVDDICDGGRTFIELAKVLKELGANKVYLVVTHGIFSKGYDVLAPYIDKIVTTSSCGIKPNSIVEYVDFTYRGDEAFGFEIQHETQEI